MITKDKFDKTWIVVAKRELAKRMKVDELKSSQELWRKEASIAKLRIRKLNLDPKRVLEREDLILEYHGKKVEAFFNKGQWKCW